MTKDPEARINMYDLQNHPWNEMPEEELEKSIEDSKLEEEEEEKKKQEEEDLSYLERLNLKDVKAKSPYTGDHYELSAGGKNKKAPRLSPRFAKVSPRFSKGGSDVNLNGSIKKGKKSTKKKKKVSIPKP